MHISEFKFEYIDKISFTILYSAVTKKNYGRIMMCGKYPKLLPSCESGDFPI